MKSFLRSGDGASKGAALMIVLAFVVILTGLMLAYFSRAGTDRQLAHSSYNDTSVDLLARSALDMVVSDFKQEILSHPTATPGLPYYIAPVPYGTPAGGPTAIPNLIRRSVSDYPPSRAAFPAVPSTAVSANGRSITKARWNSHYLIPRRSPGPGETWDTIYTDPVDTFSAPDWVLVTAQGPNRTPAPAAVIGRYAFAVYDEGGLLDMSVAGYPSWASAISACPPAAASPTPWLVNVGRKGMVGLADLTALPAAPATTFPQDQVDKIVGWRNYATTQQPGNFSLPPGGPTPSFSADCTRQDFYGSYLLYFGDPPFAIENVSDKLLASAYPFTSVAAYVSGNRTDQALTTRQELLRLRNSLGFSQNVLQYMGTFSRERNRPAPDWPNLQGNLSEGRFNLSNLALVIPNPGECNTAHGRKKGWQTGKNRNHLCGTPDEVIELFGLFWVKAEAVNTDGKHPGYWRYIKHVGPDPPGSPDPDPNSIICWREGTNHQADFFQVLHFALNAGLNRTDHCGGTGDQPRTFGVGASLIDQYDSGGDCQTTPWGPGCDLDSHVNSQYRTHTTVIEYSNRNIYAYGMEPNYSAPAPFDPISGDELSTAGTNHPHRPAPAPTPAATTQVISHAFSNVGELGYGIDTSAAGMPTLNFSSPTFPDAPVLDFFSYNPISSAYPRAGIVNLYTKNAPVLAAMLSQTLQTDAAANFNPPAPILSQSQAITAANAIVAETQAVLSGTATWPVTQTDLTRAIAARLAEKGGAAINAIWTKEQKQSIARALAEMGQTRTWNLFIDVIAQTGRYAPGTANVTDASKFTVEGEKRYWLHIALGRDLVHADGTPCAPGESGCQVDVLGTQLEQVIE